MNPRRSKHRRSKHRRRSFGPRQPGFEALEQRLPFAVDSLVMNDLTFDNLPIELIGNSNSIGESYPAVDLSTDVVPATALPPDSLIEASASEWLIPELLRETIGYDTTTDSLGSTVEPSIAHDWWPTVLSADEWVAAGGDFLQALVPVESSIDSPVRPVEDFDNSLDAAIEPDIEFYWPFSADDQSISGVVPSITYYLLTDQSWAEVGRSVYSDPAMVIVASMGLTDTSVGAFEVFGVGVVATPQEFRALEEHRLHTDSQTPSIVQSIGSNAELMPEAGLHVGHRHVHPAIDHDGELSDSTVRSTRASVLDERVPYYRLEALLNRNPIEISVGSQMFIGSEHDQRVPSKSGKGYAHHLYSYAMANELANASTLNGVPVGMLTIGGETLTVGIHQDVTSFSTNVKFAMKEAFVCDAPQTAAALPNDVENQHDSVSLRRPAGPAVVKTPFWEALVISVFILASHQNLGRLPKQLLLPALKKIVRIGKHRR